MADAGVLRQVAAYGVHRDYVFRAVVADGGEIAELAAYGLFSGKKIGHLNIDGFAAFCGNEVHFTGTQDTDVYLEALLQEMQVNGIFHHFLDAVAQVEAAEVIAESVVGEVSIYTLRNKQLC